MQTFAYLHFRGGNRVYVGHYAWKHVKPTAGLTVNFKVAEPHWNYIKGFKSIHHAIRPLE